MVRKKLQKIYKDIDKIAKKGRDNIQEYKDYIDEIINNGDFGYLEQCLYYYYNIEINENIDYVKNRTYNDILFNTHSNFLIKLKRLFQSKDIYQVGLDYYLSSNNEIIGQIVEKDLYKDYFLHYTNNRNLSNAMKERITILEVIKNGVSIIIDDRNENISEDLNLLNRYSIAISILTS
jgi:hypothetical protein